jgi:thioesterase domain-containing protein
MTQMLATKGTIVSPSELERYLREHIPLTRTMQVSVIVVRKEEVVLGAPLAPNINHRETVFGGSASALAILAAWSLLHTRLRSEGIASRLVIQRNTIDYDFPMHGAFTARSFLERPMEWERFKRMLTRKGKSRIAVSAELEYSGKVVGRFNGEFVASQN